jgi:predicted Zn-dependent peptidase
MDGMHRRVALCFLSSLDDLDPKKVLETYRRWMNPERLTVVSLVPDGERTDIADDPLANDLALSAPWAPLPPPWEAPPPPPPLEEGEEVELEVLGGVRGVMRVGVGWLARRR